MDVKLMGQVRRLIEDLAAGRYAAIAADGRAGRLTEAELRTAVEQYGRTLVPMPSDGERLVAIHEQTSQPDAVTLDVPLWTREEGRSDLTLSVTAIKQGEAYTVEVDDLHVL
ncbi:hypothetical protein Q664_51475 [Archangium violaceum Cb vi76]|uniref:DUF7668 domain-containing protein n=2 Tax=Archangium violaceum TaxID=83451 RepID=A0A084SEE0_9BACT|nr:hypothetical protein Q664_51475 [Archangium violaceum Cb vi76]